MAPCGTVFTPFKSFQYQILSRCGKMSQDVGMSWGDPPGQVDGTFQSRNIISLTSTPIWLGSAIFEMVCTVLSRGYWVTPSSRPPVAQRIEKLFLKHNFLFKYQITFVLTTKQSGGNAAEFEPPPPGMGRLFPLFRSLIVFFNWFLEGLKNLG